jgi:hypothetical protein
MPIIRRILFLMLLLLLTSASFAEDTEEELAKKLSNPIKCEHITVLGGILQSFFFSPKAPVNGWILGTGPVMLYPTTSANTLGGGQRGAGPTVVALQQSSGWTYGLLANHVTSFAGNDDGPYISLTSLPPFISYTMKTKTTIGLNTESTYDWRSEARSAPINFSVAQLFKISRLPM